MLRWFGNWRSVLLPLVCLVTGALVGFGIGYAVVSQNNSALRGSVVRLSGYDLISPLLACDVGQEDVFTELAPLRHVIESSISRTKSEGKATSISVYLRTLKSARWLEVNGSEKYTPASLLKVFIMIGYFKRAEDDPALLNRRVLFDQESTGSSAHLTRGQWYRIDDLIREMILHSNNDALQLLLSVVDVSAFDGIYKDLNITIPDIQSEDRLNLMDAPSYSMVFRVLFGATYLNPQMSEKALALLAEADDTAGLRSLLPKEVRVAHKFGLRRSESKGEPVVELHDCGIVYYPDHPYLICIMTRGSDDVVLHDAISDLSLEIYRGIDTLFRK